MIGQIGDRGAVRLDPIADGWTRMDDARGRDLERSDRPSPIRSVVQLDVRLEIADPNREEWGR